MVQFRIEPTHEDDGTRPQPGQPTLRLDAKIGTSADDDREVVLVSAEADTAEVHVYWHYPMPDPDDPDDDPRPYLVVDIDTSPAEDGPARVKVVYNDWTIHNSMTEDGM